MSLQKAKIALLSALIGLNVVAVGAPDLALAQARGVTQNDACTQWQIDNGFCKGSLRDNVKTILNFFLGFIGLIAVGFLVYGGFLYLTAGANEDNVDKAKKIIIYSFIGIVLIFLAFGIVNTAITGLGTGNEPAGTTAGR